MQKYKASDIVKRAMFLSNMKDSSFLTYKEINDSLQLAWKQAFQSVINKGCNYYLKTVSVSGSGEFNLPWDFYQCESIRTKGGFILERHNATTPDSQTSYDIVGNKLRIYGGSGDFEMRYFQSPFYLSFPSADFKIEYFEGDVVSTYNNYVAIRTNDDFTIYDFSKREEVLTISDLYTGVEVEDILLGKGTFLIHSISENVHSYFIYNYRQDLLTHVQFSDVKLFTRALDGTINVLDTNDSIWDTFATTPVSTEIGYWIDDILVGEKSLTDFVSGNVYEGDKVNGVLVFDEWSCVMADTNIEWYEDGHLFKESTDVNDYRVYGLMKCNYETGYGFLTSDGTDYYIKSFVPDTVLDFPNTLMFEYMAYILAYYFTLQSGQDTTSISALLSASEESFFDSIDNGGTYPVINNVYGGGRWLI